MAQTDSVPVLNSQRLTDLDSAESALSYLRDSYNSGDLTRVTKLDGTDALRVVSRRSSFQHYGRFRRADGLRMLSPTAVEVDGETRVRIEIEEREDA